MTDTAEVPVLVVGGGPVGLSTAFFLACHGVRPLVVERRGSTTPHPRAGTSPRTIELFRAAGLGPVLDQLGWAPEGPMSFVYKDSGVGKVLARHGLPPHFAERLATCVSTPRTALSSDQLEKVLVDEVRARGGEVRFDTRVVDVAASEASARARVVDTATGEPYEIDAAYVVGADGARSVVRTRLGISMPDREIVGFPTTAFYRADLGPTLRDWGTSFCFVRNDRVYATIGSFNGQDLWSSHLMDYPGKPEGMAQLSDQRALELVHAAIGDDTVPIELLAVNSWEASLGLATSFRRGRVFLAGDAAHLQTSAGGLGMNTGIQDGHNLAWKLAAVLRCHATPSLLDTYETERRATAEISVDYSRAMTHAVNPDQRSGNAPEIMRHEFAATYLRAMICYRYRSEAILDENEPNEDLDVLDQQVRPGYRLPHHWLSSAGTKVSTAELAGPGWLLLTGSDGHPWRPAAAALGIDVHARRVAANEDSEDALGDPDGAFRRAAGIEPDGAILVRPDGFVCWRAPAPGANPHQDLLQAVGHILRRLPRTT